MLAKLINKKIFKRWTANKNCTLHIKILITKMTSKDYRICLKNQNKSLDTIQRTPKAPRKVTREHVAWRGETQPKREAEEHAWWRRRAKAARVDGEDPRLREWTNAKVAAREAEEKRCVERTKGRQRCVGEETRLRWEQESPQPSVATLKWEKQLPVKKFETQVALPRFEAEDFTVFCVEEPERQKSERVEAEGTNRLFRTEWIWKNSYNSKLRAFFSLACATFATS